MASAYTVAQVCYTDFNNACALVAYNKKFGNIIAIYLPLGAFGPQERMLQSELNKVGIPTEIIFQVQYDRRVREAKETLYTSSKEQMGAMASFPDEPWDLVVFTAECVGGVAGCAGSVALIGQTFGIGWFLAKSTCVGAGIICANTIRDFERYKAWQQKVREEADRYQREHPTEAPVPDAGRSDSGSGIETGGSVDALGGLMDGSLPATPPTDWCQIRTCSVDIVEETPN